MATSPKTTNRRMNMDVIKLIESKHEVTILDERHAISVVFRGPAGTPYEGGIWKVFVYIPENYPFKSPSIGFNNKIFHPNIDESSGTVCMDVISEAWTPLYDLLNVFEAFLPQLLTYPNPQDPLNDVAARLYIHHREIYNAKVYEYIRKYATQEVLDLKNSATDNGSAPAAEDNAPELESDSASSLSELSEDESAKI